MKSVAISCEMGIPIVGKQFSNYLYVHKNYVYKLPIKTRMLVVNALRVAGEFDFDLVKINNKDSSICLICYPNFDADPHPVLKYRIKILTSGQYCFSNYAQCDPIILYRKESFVTSDYPHYEEFKTLTESEEGFGLLEPGVIGYQKQWNSLLSSRNLSIRGHVLYKN